MLQPMITLHNIHDKNLADLSNNVVGYTVKISFPIRGRYFFISPKKLSKLCASLLSFLCFLLCHDVFALEGFATYYTEESCKREGTSGVWTASGERFDESALTCAMRSRQWGKKFLVYSHETGRSIIVRLNDFGPGKKPTQRGVIIDLTPAGMKALGINGRGRVSVQEVQ